MHKIINAQYIWGYSISLTFDDGFFGTIDLSYLVGEWVFKKFEDKSYFQNIQVINNQRALARDDEIDMCADALYEDILSNK